MTTAELIDAAHARLLTVSEQAQLVYGLHKGTPAEFIAAVNKAYSLAKSYDRFGGSKAFDSMSAMFDRLGSSDFKVLYAAVKIAKSAVAA